MNVNIRRCVLILACLAALCAAQQPAVASSPPKWASPVQLGGDLPSSWFPDIQADATGAVRIVFSASLIEGDVNEIDGLHGAVLISELGADGWSEPADIAVMDGGIASRPMIASDGQYAHLIYRTADPGVPVRVVYRRAPLTSDLGNVHSWSQPLILSSDEAYWTQIAVLPNGGLLVVYNRVTQVDVNGVHDRRTGIFSRRSLDQGATWEPEVRVVETIGRVARTSLAVDPASGNAVLVWDEGYDNLTAQGVPEAVAAAVSSDGGASWGYHVRYPNDAEQSLVVTNGTLTVWFYRSVVDSTIYYRTSEDGGAQWSLQRPVPDAVARPYSGPHNFDKLSAAFDGDGRLLFTWVGADEAAPNGVSVMLATYADGVWTPPEVIASPVGWAEYPRIAVALGNRVELVYFVRDKEFDVGAYTLWTVRGTSDAKAVAPQEFAPVYAPTATVPSPAPIAIATQPTVPAETTPLETEIRWNDTPQKTLTSPVLPILGITAAALLGALLVRRLVDMVRDAQI
ncbi:MAG: hypothetical protein DCC58_10340 [Chloroflexi bacterium]|nr:MAG: hypothetical protein DCC58_10340 [Chloroflexota bacterium]